MPPTTKSRARVNPLGEMYASSWESFRGQEPVKDLLRDTAESARIRDAVMDHVLLESTTPGIGKTSLAMLTALELGRPIHISSGSMKPSEARIILHSLEDGQVWQIDEIHQTLNGGAKNAEWLLHFLELGQIQGPRGLEDVPRVTIIGTTTEAGRFPPAILQRFRIRPRLMPYSADEGTDIAMELSHRIGLSPAVNIATAAAIAQASSNAPRIMQSVLTVMRDLVLVGRIKGPKGNYVDRDGLLPQVVYDRTGLTYDGIPEAGILYLMELYKSGMPMGERPLSDAVGVSGTAFKSIEDLLRKKDMIALTKTGRQLTKDGILRVRQST